MKLIVEPCIALNTMAIDKYVMSSRRAVTSFKVDMVTTGSQLQCHQCAECHQHGCQNHIFLLPFVLKEPRQLHVQV